MVQNILCYTCYTTQKMCALLMQINPQALALNKTEDYQLTIGLLVLSEVNVNEWDIFFFGENV